MANTIEITGGVGETTSRMWLKQEMERFGRVDVCHMGNRMNPQEEPPWVRFYEPQGAEGALAAIRAGPQKAEAMLFELIERFRSNGEDHVKPNAGTFRAVLLAYKNTIRGKAGKQIAAKAEQLLQIREGLKAASAAASSAVDEIALAEIAMGMISRSKDPRKTVRVHRILSKHLSAGGLATQRMHKLVLEAAASTTSGNAEEKLEAFRIALDVYKEFREDGDGGGSAMNGSVVGLFLRACHRLLSNGQKRNDVVRAVFGEARDRGLVSGFVLGELDTAASEDLQLELLGGFVVDGVNIPEAWKRNVPDPR